VPALSYKNVRRLDVAMDDSLLVRRIQRVGNVDAQIEQEFEVQRAALDGVLQRLAVETLHRKVGVAVFPADIVNRANVGMIQRGRRLRLAAKPFERHLISAQIFRQEFQRNKSVKPRVFGFVDNAHAAAAQLFHDAVMRNGAAYEGLSFSHVWKV
jgi:hypothetical protein